MKKNNYMLATRTLTYKNIANMCWFGFTKVKGNKFNLAISCNPLNKSLKPITYKDLGFKFKGKPSKVIEQFEVTYNEKQFKKFMKDAINKYNKWIKKQ